MDPIHTRVKNLRLQKNYPQKRVAACLGISQAAYSKLEAGKNKISIKHLFNLCECFECSPELLLGNSKIT